jgi:hypothetical protein
MDGTFVGYTVNNVRIVRFFTPRKGDKKYIYKKIIVIHTINRTLHMC